MRIIHPRPEDGAQSAHGVDFVDGVATVESLHPERELALRQHGFTIEEDVDVAAPFQEALGEPIIDLEDLTVPQLRDLAEEHELDVPSKVTKAELIALLGALPADPIPGDVDNGDGTFTATADGVEKTETGEQTGAATED